MLVCRPTCGFPEMIKSSCLHISLGSVVALIGAHGSVLPLEKVLLFGAISAAVASIAAKMFLCFSSCEMKRRQKDSVFTTAMIFTGAHFMGSALACGILSLYDVQIDRQEALRLSLVNYGTASCVAALTTLVGLGILACMLRTHSRHIRTA